VYLYLNRGRQVSKYQLLADLWPEAENADPGRVKHTVQVLRATLEGHSPIDGWRFIHERAGAYSFNCEAARWSDVEQFDAQLALGRQARQLGDHAAALAHVRRAIDLRQGPFLGEFRYDDWAAAEIARLQEAFLEALEEGARLEAEQGAYARAIDLLRRAVAEDPLHESSYVELMRSMWLDGRRTDAVRVYHRLREVLARKLGVEPQAQTTRLYEQIRRDEAVAV
jgi:DNA-binding SARP family transcriptional activator